MTKTAIITPAPLWREANLYIPFHALRENTMTVITGYSRPRLHSYVRRNLTTVLSVRGTNNNNNNKSNSGKWLPSVYTCPVVNHLFPPSNRHLIVCLMLATTITSHNFGLELFILNNIIYSLFIYLFIYFLLFFIIVHVIIFL